MSSTRKRRVIIAWVLLIAFIPILMVKSVHHHGHGCNEPTSCTHSDQSNDKPDHCAICKYALSLFTEARTVEFHCTFTFAPFEPVIYQDKVVCEQAYSYLLRAPPIA